MDGSLVSVWRVKQALLLGLAFAVVLALSFVSAAKPAQAQVVVSGEVLNVLVDVEQGECGTGGCPAGERPVTVTPVLSLNTELEALLTAEQADAVLEAAAAVAVFGEITITDSTGAVVATVDPGETVCLEPGDFTASASVVNAEVTADAALDALAGLGLGDIDISLLVGDVLVIEEPFVVAECPGDGGPGGGGSDQDFGDITLEECSAIINNNTGAQYSPEINQRCIDIIENGGGGGDNGDVTNITIDINGDGFIDEADAIDLNGDGIFDAADLEIAEAGATGTAAASASPASDDSGGGSGSSDGGGSGSSDDAAAAATGGTATLPETGGASLLALGAGALLVASGLLARRIIQ